VTVLMVSIGDERFDFDTSMVSGLDAWEFYHAVGSDLLEVLAEFGRLVDAGQAPPFHLAVVGKWLAIRQGDLPFAAFAGVAATTFVPAHDDVPVEVV